MVTHLMLIKMISYATFNFISVKRQVTIMILSLELNKFINIDKKKQTSVNYKEMNLRLQ